MEPHIVTTSDGYIMQMERIPRRGELSPYIFKQSRSRMISVCFASSGVRMSVHGQLLRMAPRQV